MRIPCILISVRILSFQPVLHQSKPPLEKKFFFWQNPVLFIIADPCLFEFVDISYSNFLFTNLGVLEFPTKTISKDMCEEHSVLVACVRVFVFRCKCVFVCHNALVGASCPSQVIAWPATWGMVTVSHLVPRQTPPPPSLSSPHNLVFDYKLQFLFVKSCCWGASLIWVGQELDLRIGEWLGLLPAHSLTFTI